MASEKHFEENRNFVSSLRRPSWALITRGFWIAFIFIFIVYAYYLPPFWLPGPQSLDYLTWPSSPPSYAWPDSNGISYGELQDILESTPDPDKLAEWSRYYTSGPHLTGTNLSQAEWTKDLWQEFGVQNTSIVSYDVYVNYLKSHRLALLSKSGKGLEVLYEASLEENKLDKDDTSQLDKGVPAFHAYSGIGNATASYVFVNYGTYQDYDDLLESGVDLTGKIALARYGQVFRGLKVKRAQELGMVGVVIYSDPGDDGKFTEAKGYEVYPYGPAREPSSIQRGSTLFLTISAGDPTTPGYPSKPGVPRMSPNASIPTIPSLPISYQDALPLLQALNNHGPHASVFRDWQGGGLTYKNITYHVGPSPSDIVLNLINDQEYTITPIWNVIGIINGTLEDEVIIMGNHRDAWIAGGAGDPNSGSAALNELIRGYGKALRAGWKPLRTIVFASWDGEEYGILGSTEWVEEYIPWLSKSAIAYVNVDAGASGPNFLVAAAPLLHKSLIKATNTVQSPDQTSKGQTVGDVWGGTIGILANGSDFTAFQDFAGIPCIDMGFNYGPDMAVYHYHSNYDSWHWMDKYGDPGWQYHKTISKLWGLLSADLIENPVIQFNATDYSSALFTYLRKLEDKLKNSGIVYQKSHFNDIEVSIHGFHDAAVKLDAEAGALMAILTNMIGKPQSWYQLYQRRRLYQRVQRVNNRYKYLERQFLHPDGLDGRSWYKHTLFAPGLWTGHDGTYFPGLEDSYDRGNLVDIDRWRAILVKQIVSATKLLSGK